MNTKSNSNTTRKPTRIQKARLAQTENRSWTLTRIQKARLAQTENRSWTLTRIQKARLAQTENRSWTLTRIQKERLAQTENRSWTWTRIQTLIDSRNSTNSLCDVQSTSSGSPVARAQMPSACALPTTKPAVQPNARHFHLPVPSHWLYSLLFN